MATISGGIVCIYVITQNMIPLVLECINTVVVL